MSLSFLFPRRSKIQSKVLLCPWTSRRLSHSCQQDGPVSGSVQPSLGQEHRSRFHQLKEESSTLQISFTIMTMFAHLSHHHQTLSHHPQTLSPSPHHHSRMMMSSHHLTVNCWQWQRLQQPSSPQWLNQVRVTRRLPLLRERHGQGHLRRP